MQTDRHWHPHVTVAALVERRGRFLLVEEQIEGRSVFNQPAGHLEQGEGLIDAVVRETLEETAGDFVPEAVVGVYRWVAPHSGATFLRLCFSGRCAGFDAQRPLDAGITGTAWLTRDELAQAGERLRSPLVLRCIDDYIAGARYPLQIIGDLAGD